MQAIKKWDAGVAGGGSLRLNPWVIRGRENISHSPNSLKGVR